MCISHCFYGSFHPRSYLAVAEYSNRIVRTLLKCAYDMCHTELSMAPANETVNINYIKQTAEAFKVYIRKLFNIMFIACDSWLLFSDVT